MKWLQLVLIKWSTQHAVDHVKRMVRLCETQFLTTGSQDALEAKAAWEYQLIMFEALRNGDYL